MTPRLLLIALLFCFYGAKANSDGMPKDSAKAMMQITALESTLPGGVGRSKLIIPKMDGSRIEEDPDNLFSFSGINFRNIRNNDERLLKVLKQYTSEGWTVNSVTSFTLSQSDKGQGIFMTRYLLSR